MLKVQRVLLSLLFTTIICGAADVIPRLFHPPAVITPYNTIGFVIFIDITLGTLFIGLPNILFLLILYYTKVGKEFLLNIRLLILEICLLYITSLLTGYIIDLLPSEYKFDQSIPGILEKRIYVSDVFQWLYTYILLFFILLFIKKIFISRKKGSVQNYHLETK